MRYDSLTRMADQLMWFKYVVKNVARRHGKTRDVHAQAAVRRQRQRHARHQSLWKEGKPLFAGDGYAGLSEMALHYIGGILKHAPALCALTNPTINSYRRLVPGYEAPVNLAYSAAQPLGGRSASRCTRRRPKAKRIEARFPDSSGNPYLAFAAMLMAGLDGIQQQARPGRSARQGHLLAEPRGAARTCPTCPRSLEEAARRARADHEFLLQGDVFTKDIIDEWIEYKRTRR